MTPPATSKASRPDTKVMCDSSFQLKVKCVIFEEETAMWSGYGLDRRAFHSLPLLRLLVSYSGLQQLH